MVYVDNEKDKKMIKTKHSLSECEIKYLYLLKYDSVDIVVNPNLTRTRS